MASNVVTLSKIKEDLKDILECPICLMVPNYGPIYQCQNGHIVCKDCHSKLSECPQCRSRQISIRALYLEKILERFPKRCRMSDDCPIELLMPELKIHEDECKYRKVKCPKCLKDISLISLLDHLIEKHDDIQQFFQCPINKEWKGPTESQIVQYYFTAETSHLVVDQKSFLIQEWCLTSEDGAEIERVEKLYICVFLMGTKLEACEYEFTVKLSSHNKKRSVAYNGKVTSIYDEHYDIISNGLANEEASLLEKISFDCLILPHQMLSNLGSFQNQIDDDPDEEGHLCCEMYVDIKKIPS